MSKILRKISLILIFLYITAAGFAEIPDPYAPADDATKKILTEVDDLITQKKYESAFNQLGQVNDNEYLLAKKISLCINYFVSSIMHQEFAFKDLAENESLNDARSNNAAIQTIPFNPVATVGEFEKQKGPSAILEKTLGDYYASVYNHYSGNWLSSDEEILTNCEKYYQMAYEKDCYELLSLDNYGLASIQLKHFDNAIEAFQKELTFTDTADIHYNLALAYINIADNKSAFAQASKAAEGYENNDDYRTDAYLLCADALTYDNNTEEAENYVNKILSYSENNYRAFDELIFINLTAQKLDAAALYADKLFALAPESPAATQMVFRRYYSENKEELEKFFKRNLETYKDQPADLGNLYYHLAYYYLSVDKKEDAITNANLAKTNYIAAEQYTDNTKDAIDQLLNQCTQ